MDVLSVIRVRIRVDASAAFHDLWEAQWTILTGEPWYRSPSLADQWSYNR